MIFIATRAAASSHQVSCAPSNYSDLNPKKAYGRNFHAFLERYIKWLPGFECQRRDHLFSPAKNFYLSVQTEKTRGAYQEKKDFEIRVPPTIQPTKQKAEETKKDPVYRGYHLFNGAGMIAGPAALFASFR